MPAYSFKIRFVPLIKDGVKRQTIRRKRKRQAKPGDTLYLYYALRTKFCTKLGEATCTKVSNIRILRNGKVYINSRCLTKDQKDRLAYEDGFRVTGAIGDAGCFNVMFRWWQLTHDLPFKGDIIYWDKINIVQ